MSEMIVVAPADLVRLTLFERITGISEKAVLRKIEDGHFRVNKEVVKAPDGKWLVSLPGYYAWAYSAG
jgi:hypothetical protein